jgi:hypothetical protein
MATMKVGAAPSDWEDEALQSQIATAQALRNKGLNDPTGQMIGDWYMAKSPWAILGQTAGGGLLEQQARGRQGEIQGAREQQFNEWSGARPSPMTTQTQELAGPMPEGGPEILTGTAQVPKPFQQQAAEMQDWSAKGAQIRHPLAQSMAAAGMQHALTMPEKQLAAEVAAEEKKQALALSLAAKAEAERIRMEDKEAARQLSQADKQENMRLAGAIAAENRRSQRDRFQVVQGADGTMHRVNLETGEAAPITAGGQALKKPNTAETKSLNAAQNIVDKVDAALAELEAQPDAVGLKTLVPDIALQRINPAGGLARAKVAELAAEKAHELYGAAFTGAERTRANQFLPGPGDNIDTVKKKLKNMRDLAVGVQTRAQGKTPAAPGGGSYGDADKEARYQAWKASQGK